MKKYDHTRVDLIGGGRRNEKLAVPATECIREAGHVIFNLSHEIIELVCSYEKMILKRNCLLFKAIGGRKVAGNLIFFYFLSFNLICLIFFPSLEEVGERNLQLKDIGFW